MLIEKTWINRKKGEHNFILFNNDTLYRRLIKDQEFNRIENEINNGIIDDKFIGLPISYIKTIEFREDDDALNIEYGKDSEDEIKVSDPILRKDIFDYIKANTSFVKFKQQQPSIIRRIKKPLIALVILLGIFLYIYSIIDGMNQGYEYELVGSGGPGIAGIVLMMAGLGLLKNVLIFGSLASIAMYRIYKNYQDDSEIFTLVYK